MARASSPSMPPLAAGIKLARRFEVLGVARRGGRGDRVRRTSAVTERERVALKVLHGHLLGDRQFRGRFEREAKILRHLEGTARLPGARLGRAPRSRGTRRARSSTWRSRRSTARRSTRCSTAKGRFPMSRALDVILQVFDALRMAHAQGIVHRDLEAGERPPARGEPRHRRGLRAREDPRRRLGRDGAHGAQHGLRHARVHGARAGAGRRDRRAVRRLRGRRDALRDAHRRAALHRADAAQRPHRASHVGARAAARTRPGARDLRPRSRRSSSTRSRRTRTSATRRRRRWPRRSSTRAPRRTTRERRPPDVVPRAPRRRRPRWTATDRRSPNLPAPLHPPPLHRASVPRRTRRRGVRARAGGWRVVWIVAALAQHQRRRLALVHAP